MSILFRSLPNGWPDALVREDHVGPTPSGHVAFDTWEGVWAWKDANEDKRPAAPPPPPPVPASVPKWAFLLILRRMGKEAALKAAIAGYTGPNADRVRAKWDADPDIERGGQTVDDLGAAMGLTPPQIDQAFREAKVEADK